MLSKIFGSGWRVIATLKTIIVFIFTIFGTVLIYRGVTVSGSIDRNFVFFHGKCGKAKSVNTWLHLLLNACSTGVLASSNFFMQVLSSPTRSEIDKAHGANRALKIGVQSLRNVFWTSKIKFVYWILFFVSSFPLHLFFNSAIFATENLGTDWHLTISSEAFVDGAQYFGPGAALWPPRGDTDWEGYGLPRNVSEYFDPSSNASKKIEVASRYARSWKKLKTRDCVWQYVYCNPRVTFADVVMVVESQNETSMSEDGEGWNRTTLFKPFNSTTDKSFWDKHVPANESNSLWFAADCRTSVSSDQRPDGKCSQTCGRAVGFWKNESMSTRLGSLPSDYTFEFSPYASSYMADEAATNLTLKYCLVDELSQKCKVAISNQLLIIVVASIAVKGVLCLAVLFTLPKEQPLVVLGDAIESFICSPDQSTIGRCLMDRDLEEDMGAGCAFAMTAAPTCQSWLSAIDRQTWARSYGMLSMDIILLAGGFIAANLKTPLAGQSLLQSMSNGILSISPASAVNFMDFVLRANLPQLLLSITYFIYNNIYTHLCAEKEWNSYGGDFRPLRVSRPKGQQRTAYRLQLPYRYSVPLIIVSIFTHWLVSNAFYIFVAEGDYYEWSQQMDDSEQRRTGASETGLSIDAFVGIGYSTLTILILFITMIILPIIPTLVGQRKVKTAMPLAGASSVVISAACHVPVLEENSGTHPGSGVQKSLRHESRPVEDDEDPIYEMINLRGTTDDHEPLVSMDIIEGGNDTEETSYGTEFEALDAQDYLREVARNPVRWGAVKVPPSWTGPSTELSDGNIAVGHLSFGTELHDVQEPVAGQWYA
ncbi:hypothetical protein NW752_006946 [Fusarium irregulare]|uniref:DUF6536 domain-containing protein n=1 Tax=Fusarium irregulare TaxID=2494466 RepID=A0A9W8PRY3_9HYPO|nr:hypothetical protein NW766_005828 [Fusarium irregulare]KAJ4016013.1 hypothetical protein NW752_006946 [Fusarium irregulare]